MDGVIVKKLKKIPPKKITIENRVIELYKKYPQNSQILEVYIALYKEKLNGLKLKQKFKFDLINEEIIKYLGSEFEKFIIIPNKGVIPEIIKQNLIRIFNNFENIRINNEEDARRFVNNIKNKKKLNFIKNFFQS